MIGSDRKLFEPGSAVSERIKEYGGLVGELHIIVFAKSSLGLKEKQIAPNVWLYPTNSLSRWFYVRDAVKIGKKIVFNKKFIRGRSVITTQDPFECGLAGLKVKSKWRIPLEVQLHTDPFSPYFSGLLNFLRKRIAKKVLHKADSIRVVSEPIKNSLLTSYSLLPTSISILPIYIDRERIESAKLSFDLHARYPWHFILLTVSRLTKEKNIGLALKSLALVRERFPDTGLIVVGAGPEEKSLRQKAKSLNLEAGVEFVGWQEPARTTEGVQSGGDLASYYKTANAYIQTSFFEGYGLSLIEAGLSGLPVLTTPVGIALELEHEKDAYIYPAGHPELFAQGISDLIENNQKRENLRVNLKEKLESKLMSKEDYLSKMGEAWEATAKHIR